MKTSVVAVLAAIALAGCGPGGPSGNDPPGPDTASVVRVVDGDTVVAELAGGEEPVRLLGIDTPEAEGGFLPEECYGNEASAYTQELIPPGTAITLTRDHEPRDRYDRLLAYVFRAEDGLFVNLELARRGAADALNIPPNSTYAREFASAAAAARDGGLGLWAACGGPDVQLE